MRRMKDKIEGSITNADDALHADSVPWSGVQNPPSTYTPSEHTHPYLPLGGGTMSGNINFAGIGDNASSAGITWGGSTDGAGIYYQTTESNQGNLVLNLTDDNNCYLRIAQNGNFKSYFSPNDGNFHGDVNGTADVANVANFAKETYINQYKTVNLTDLDQNTWYPVTGTGIPYNGLRRFKCNVQLNSGSKPSWSTHSAGFTAVVDILEESSGWGTTSMLGMVLVNDQYWINDYNKPPVGYQQMSYGSIPVWWLRGGGSYRLATDYDCTWTIQKSKYENSGQSVSPTTTYPGVSVNRSTITANLNGNAKTATNATNASNSDKWAGLSWRHNHNTTDTWIPVVSDNAFDYILKHEISADKLPLTGGTISGALNFANGTWNCVGDDAYMGDHNIAGSFCIMGANDTTRLALVNKDNQGDYALVEYGGGNLNFNKKLGANITGHADGDLSLGGGTINGDIVFSNCGTGVRQIQFSCADNDYGRVAVGGTASNAGYMEIATADDGSEPIYVRQYSGVYANIVRSASLLDGNGNTSFPGAVTANTYYAPNWFRATGDSGFYFENHGGGWYMIDDTWIRAYNNKNIYTPGVIQCDSGFNGNLNGNATTSTLVRHQGNVTAISGTATRTAGLQLYGAYNNGYPMTYGNVICASNGSFGSEIALDCVGGDGKRGPGRMYYRNRSDWGTSEWSDWATIAYLTDKVAGAGTADNAEYLGNDAAYMRMHWNGQGGQPTWLWGGNDPSNMYVWNPSNFSVNYATTAGNGVGASKVITDKKSGYIRFNNGIQICWGSENCSSKNTTVVFAIPFINNEYAVTITGYYDNFGGTYWTTGSHKETQFNINGSKSSIDNRYMNWIAIGQWFNSN